MLTKKLFNFFNKKNNYIVISSCFGHEFMALNFAKALRATVLVSPEEDNKEIYLLKANAIMAEMSPFYHKIKILPFEEKKSTNAKNLVKEIIEQTLDDNEWHRFAKTKLSPQLPKNLPTFSINNAILFNPQKLTSDCKLGINALQQSLPLSVFDFLKEKEQLVLGQNFNKNTDLGYVQHLAQLFNLYVPGMSENPEILGIRNVPHIKYYNMYANLKAAIGIAGTHTWILLTMFPHIPQIILYNKKILEHWDAIEKAYQNAGRKIFCIGFDEKTNIAEFTKKIEQTYKNLF